MFEKPVQLTTGNVESGTHGTYSCVVDASLDIDHGRDFMAMA
jgi:hypothetical protein